jgi:hypothetical protein
MATTVRTGPAGRRRESQSRPEAPALRWYDRLLIAFFVVASVAVLAMLVSHGPPAVL